MDFNLAPDIKRLLRKIIRRVDLPHIDGQRIVCFRSHGSKSRAIARIWSLPRIWQKALKVEAHYCIEVLSQRFDRLDQEEKIKVLIHELLHIPKNFSGSLLPHSGRRKFGINQRNIDKLFKDFEKNNSYGFNSR